MQQLCNIKSLKMTQYNMNNVIDPKDFHVKKIFQLNEIEL